MDIGQLSFDIDQQETSSRATSETIGEQFEKRNQFPSQRGNLFKRHPDDPP